MNRRRACLGLAGWLGAGALAPVHAHGLLGQVTPPLALPLVALTLDDGRRVPLASVLQGRLTALQLMFTGCSALCPVQGAVFAELQHLVLRGTAPAGAVRPQALQLLSVSIDVLGDDARTLAAWRARFGAGPQWRAAVPDPAGIDPLLDLLRGRTGGPDRHTTQVFVLDGRGRLVYRCAELAAAESVAQVLRQRSLAA
jgi:protein SCO1/2